MKSLSSPNGTGNCNLISGTIVDFAVVVVPAIDDADTVGLLFVPSLDVDLIIGTCPVPILGIFDEIGCKIVRPLVGPSLAVFRVPAKELIPPSSVSLC